VHNFYFRLRWLGGACTSDIRDVVCIPASRKVHSFVTQVGVEKLREWFSQVVLHPLQQAVANAHMDVINSAARIGMATGLRLSPLDATGQLYRVHHHLVT
jgi:hypothetical protein